MTEQQPTRVGDVPVFRTLKVIADLIRDNDLPAPISVSLYEAPRVLVKPTDFDAWFQATDASTPVETFRNPEGARHWKAATAFGLHLIAVTDQVDEHHVTALITEAVPA